MTNCKVHVNIKEASIVSSRRHPIIRTHAWKIEHRLRFLFPYLTHRNITIAIRAVGRQHRRTAAAEHRAAQRSDTVAPRALKARSAIEGSLQTESIQMFAENGITNVGYRLLEKKENEEAEAPSKQKIVAANTAI